MLKQFRTSALGVLPITLIILVLSLVLGIASDDIIGCLIAAVLLAIGMTLFNYGANVGIMPIGELIGSGLTQSRKLWLILFVSIATGVLITVAEPGLLVLGNQVSPAINKWTLVFVVGLGTGISLMMAMLRTLFNIKLNMLFLFCYSLIFLVATILSATGNGDLMTLAFDSSGATTGAITVPYIMSFGIGIAAIKGHSEAEDNFGLIAICSTGPILAVLILGLVSGGGEGITIGLEQTSFSFIHFLTRLPTVLLDCLIPLALIVVFFLVFQAFFIKVSFNRLLKIFIGCFYTLIGLVIFLLGANVGFMPLGSLIGELVASSDYFWILIPIGMVVGFFIVAAEPAIHVLNAKVEEISMGVIKKHHMLIALMIGIGLSIGLSMVRIIFDLNFWFIIAPGYLVAISLMFFSPKMFTAIAFDSGGVASGPMTSAFLLPLATGACYGMQANGGSGILLEYAFGVIALVAMTPLITIQAMGVVAQQKQKKLSGLSRLLVDDEVIVLI